MTNLRRSYKDSWGCFDVPAKRAELADATSVLNDPKAWPDHSKISRANQVAKSNSSLLDAFDRISKDIDFLIEIAALGEPVGAERDRLAREMDALLPARIDADKAVFLTIRAGAGGHEACSWASMLLRMYFQYAQRHSLDMEMLDVSPYESDGIRSVTVKVSGKGAFALFEREGGVHKLSRVSPYDQADRRQTSFAAVEVEPEAGKEVTVNDSEIERNEIEVTTCRSGGPGGQNTNKVESVAIVKHLPTGIVVRCQIERSQGRNREIAMEILKAKLLALKKAKEDKAKAEKRAISPRADFGSGTRRVYVLVSTQWSRIT